MQPNNHATEEMTIAFQRKKTSRDRDTRSERREEVESLQIDSPPPVAAVFAVAFWFESNLIVLCRKIMADGGKAAAPRHSVGHVAEDDEFVGHWGRMGHLTPEQSALTETFTAKQEAALKLTKYPPESLQNTALRFLRARKFDPEAAAVLLAKCNEMKAAGGAARFAALPPDECAKCNVAGEFHSLFWHLSRLCPSLAPLLLTTTTQPSPRLSPQEFLPAHNERL